MHREELRQRQPRCVGEVRPCSTFNLRELRLTNRCSSLATASADFVGLLDRSNQFLLDHRAVQTAKASTKVSCYDLCEIKHTAA
jgi:hypothetical protein